MAMTLNVKLGDVFKNLRFSTVPQPSLTEVLSTMYESFSLGKCTATFADDFGNLHTLDDSNLLWALEIMARGQTIELLLTKVEANKSEEACEVATCSFGEDEKCAQNYQASILFCPSKGGKAWHKGGLWKGSWKGAAWTGYPGGQGKGRPWWNNNFGFNQDDTSMSSWYDGSGVGMATGTSTVQTDFSISDGELEWKLAVLRRMGGCSSDSFLVNALLANHGNLQQTVDGLRAM